MKIQIHSLINRNDVAPNIGIAYLHNYKTIALGLLFFSVTITWHKAVKENEAE